MALDRFITVVSERLTHPLPGWRAQLRMSSMRRVQELMGTAPILKATSSAVLLLVYPIGPVLHLVFIQRPEYGGVHAGQISLPGGKREPGDRDLITTALRESQEEVGIIPAEVEVLGRLSDLYIPPSRYLVTPFIGCCRTRPEFIRDPEEVREIIEIRLLDLFHRDAVQVLRHSVGMGIRVKSPAFVVDGHVIWGATAMILSEFREVAEDFLSVQ